MLILIFSSGFYYFSFVTPEEITDFSDIRLSFVPDNKIHLELTDSRYFLANTAFHFSENKDTLFINFQKSSQFNIFCGDKKTDATFPFVAATHVIQYCNTNIPVTQNHDHNSTSIDSISYKGKELFLVQSMCDERGTVQGKVYIEKIPHEDSTFKSLYIFNNNQLLYFVGDGILTNFIDSTNSIKNYYGYQFSARDPHYIEFSIVNDHGLDVSDLWRITYNEADKRFEAPYDDFQ